MAARATAALAAAEELLLADLVVAECVYVLESFYEVERERVAELMRAAIALPSVKTVDSASLRRALEVYQVERLDFAEAYLVAQAEATGVGSVLSFDQFIDRVAASRRQEPWPSLAEVLAAQSRCYRAMRKLLFITGLALLLPTAALAKLPAVDKDGCTHLPGHHLRHHQCALLLRGWEWSM